MHQELNAGIDTVISIADHFDGLKQRVADLTERFSASERGFFTPSEDDEVRHLHVSWWQSRNALFELVTSFHRLHQFPESDHPPALLTAYAGALVLVDVARFVREQFHNRPVVRRRLNNPDPLFGIPAGTYDRIQKSLTSPVHAWHLYHAGRFIAEHDAELDSAAASMAGLQQVREIVARLQDRLKVSVDRYLLAQARVRARSLRLGPRLIGRALYGIQKCVGRLMSDRYLRAGHRPGLPDAIAAELSQMLLPGDVIVTRKNHSLTNYFLPGYWPHVALYIGTVDELEAMQLQDHPNVRPHWNILKYCDAARSQRVLEALKDGVRARSIGSPFGSDEFVILRPNLTRDHVASVIPRGFAHVGKAYDFNFDFSRSDRLVCTELVYRSFEGIGGIGFQLTWRAGRLTLSAEDLLNMAEDSRGFCVEAVFSPTHVAEITTGEAAGRLLRRTMSRATDPAAG